MKQGDKMDNFELSNAIGNKVTLFNVLKDGPTVISFYRGGWCPYCNMELRACNSSVKLKLVLRQGSIDGFSEPDDSIACRCPF